MPSGFSILQGSCHGVAVEEAGAEVEAGEDSKRPTRWLGWRSTTGGWGRAARRLGWWPTSGWGGQQGGWGGQQGGWEVSKEPVVNKEAGEVVEGEAVAGRGGGGRGGGGGGRGGGGRGRGGGDDE
uniref:Uncharacterized protein n=1 Tax=Ditylenchus dipsaci TaxID=166011 RepID=A0A915E9F2_9BILA